MGIMVDCKSNDASPSVSIIVPVLNGDATIERCLDSILDLQVPAGGFEVIVLENGSTDGTAQILDRYLSRVRIIHEPKRGPSAARNTGILNARGELIAFTDADCIVEPNWLSNLLRPLEDCAVGIVGGEILSVRPCNSVELFGERIHDHRRAIEQLSPPYAITMNWASRRRVLLEVGMFDETLLRGSDCELAMRIHRAGYRLVYVGNARVRHHNERTLRGLFAEGFKHGAAAIRVRRRFLAEPMHWRYRASSTGRRILRNLKEIFFGESPFQVFCDIVFDVGKLAGHLSPSARDIPTTQQPECASDSLRR